MTEQAGGETGSGARLFWTCAAAAVLLHTLLALIPPLIRGGADLLPHLRLMQQMAEDPDLRTVYAPAYHAIGALLSLVIGLGAVPKLFAFASVLAMIAGFRAFQRAAGLPDASAALFVLFPYSFALSWCLPKVEAAGCALVFVGLACLVRRRYAATAALLAVTFLFHTASALLYGLAGGVLSLARRDLKGLAALAAGSVAAAPLFALHLADGCTPAEAFLLSQADYLRDRQMTPLPFLDRILVLANPVMLVLGALGARPLWQRNRALAITCAVVAVFYLNELWLAPFEKRTSLNLMRGLSTLAFPVSVAAGVALQELTSRWQRWILAGCALWAAVAVFSVVPSSCHVHEFALAELQGLEVSRCQFSWRGPAIRRPGRPPAPADDPRPG
jgi:hypothetical protein